MNLKIETLTGPQEVKPFLRVCIRHFCELCFGHPDPAYCMMADCPLYPYRQNRGVSKGKQRRRAEEVRRYCREVCGEVLRNECTSVCPLKVWSR